MTTTIQDRVKLISGLLSDCAGRQMEEAIQADPVRTQLSLLFTDVIDGVYIEDQKISREELMAMPLDQWVAFLAKKRTRPKGPVALEQDKSKQPLPDPEPVKDEGVKEAEKE